ncbi:unnamed protein product [Trifolium pratense]|uniref:Uncharacterized protein n=1 Tax=Trifolium pratense TaxID=57577 RepID=A0ACB0KKP7_TRIPR|nr:unnamed protein product [Trifolium pratense]
MAEYWMDVPESAIGCCNYTSIWGESLQICALLWNPWQTERLTVFFTWLLWSPDVEGREPINMCFTVEPMANRGSMFLFLLGYFGLLMLRGEPNGAQESAIVCFCCAFIWEDMYCESCGRDYHRRIFGLVSFDACLFFSQLKFWISCS